MTVTSKMKPESKAGVPVVPRGPNCQKGDSALPFEFDFSKSYLDPLEERPGHQHLNLKKDGTDLPGIGDK